MFPDLMGLDATRFVIAIVGVAAALLLLVGVLWLVRGRAGPSPFVRGGKNRQPRLQVLDAAAVDTRRRLVLIRRDDVEHLVMIGGPTDIVIESRISSSLQSQPLAMQRPLPVETAHPALMQAAPMQPALPQAEPRQIAAQRALPAEPRAELPRDIPATRETSRPSPAVAPIAAASGTMTAAPRASASELAVSAPSPVRSEAPRTEPQSVAAPDVKAQPLRPIAALAAASSQRSLDSAANVLEANRGRVLAEAPEARPAPLPAAVAAPPVVDRAAERPKQLGTDFERILQDEMAQNLAAGQPADLTIQPQRRIPPRDPSAPQITGATREPSLQAEVARIFGEMSAGRDR